MTERLIPAASPSHDSFEEQRGVAARAPSAVFDDAMVEQARRVVDVAGGRQSRVFIRWKVHQLEHLGCRADLAPGELLHLRFNTARGL